MRLLGKLNENPVFEVDEGQYVIVNPKNGRWNTTWAWSGLLGRNYDSFTKCSGCEEEDKCLEIIRKNRDLVLDRLEIVSENAKSPDGKRVLEKQKEFYDSLEEGKKYIW